ncbi:MAG: cytochrome C, partial [bacterium]
CSIHKQHSDGIHWHIDNKVEFIATDERRQDIPWVKVTYLDGASRIFKTEESETNGDGSMPKGIHTMDCIDCHNRPSHIFQPPQIALNSSIDAGRIASDMASIKSTAVEALEAAEEDSTVEAGLATIANSIRTFYEEDNPEIWETRQAEIETAITEVQKIYQQNYFPKMKTSWRSHANNIGHFNGPGCYRCHDGLHIAEDGAEISNDCNICHLIIEQGDDATVTQKDLSGLEFKHPEDIDEEWKETGCYECHEG